MTTKYFDLLKSPLKGTNLIEASAGTGKTYAIAGLFLRLILEKGIPVDKILAVTYTEAATEELRYRIRERLKDALKTLRDDSAGCYDELLSGIAKKYRGNEAAMWRLKDALTRFDEASICTIHGFCRRMLAENAFESSSLFNAELIADQSRLFQEIIDDFWRKNFYSASYLFIQYAGKIKISPSYFLKLLANFSIDPCFKVIPQVKKPDISKIEIEFINAFKELAREWTLSKFEIEDILLKNEGLDRTKYSARYMPKWIIEMDNYLSSDNPVMIFDKFEKFTSPSINDSVKNGFSPPAHGFFDLCAAFEKTYNKLISIFNTYILYIEAGIFEFVKHEAGKRKQKLNNLTFDDLLVNMHNALCKKGDGNLAEAVRLRYKAALIDEFQDTDPVQYGIFNIIFGAGDSILFLIGDPKQSIYKFRGADIFAYLKASKNIESRYTLGTNWRSTSELIKAVNTIFKTKERPFVFKDIEYTPQTPPRGAYNNKNELIINNIDKPFHIRMIGKGKSDKKGGIITKGRAEAIISKAVAGEIFRLASMGRDGAARIGSSALKPGHIAVLVRKQRQARALQQELARFNIPGVLYGSESIFASHEAMEMERVIAAIAGYVDERLLKAALATDMLGLSGNEIFNLAGNEDTWEKYLNRFYEYHDLWANHGFFRMFRSFTDNEGVRERLLSFTDGDRRITNILHLAELLHRAETENKLGHEALVKWIGEKMALLEDSGEHEIRLESDEDAVKLITIHRSKGLEFDIVFCPFAWEGSTVDKSKPFTFHDPDNNYNLTLDLACEEKNRSTAETEELAENMRLLYVALTRAKHSSYLFWGRINEAETSALSYIFHDKDRDDPADPVTRLRDSAKFMSYETMLKDINDIAGASGGAISVNELPEYEYERYIQSGSARDEMTCRAFAGNIRRDWAVSSFSALVYGQWHAERPDHDRINYPSISGEDLKAKNKDHDIFSFPKGAVPGTCIHKIFECLDYSLSEDDAAKELINNVLAKYGIGPEWRDAVFDMVKRVTGTQLLQEHPGLILKNISFRDRLNELEFYFPLKPITAKGLADIFHGSGMNFKKDFAVSLEDLGFRPHRGFVKGFIDMVFEHDGRFYIVDWKSNYLGPDIQDYAFNKIRLAMQDNYYILQYYIYAVALHSFLSARKPGYDYAKHFGGVFYVFVRGVDPRYPSSGIYHDLPAKDMIDSLHGYLCPVPEAVS